MQIRLSELKIKLQEETLTPEEQVELIEITDQIEQADAERLDNLILLAQLRNVPLEVLMAQLGIR